MTTSSTSFDIDPKMDLSELRHIEKHIAEVISLPDFIETEAGTTIRWHVPDQAGKCVCPLHNENKPSFSINLMDGVWVFHCFGCEAKGTVVHFCRDFYNLRNKLEAIYYLCQKYNIKNTGDLILEGIRKVSVQVDEQRLLENGNILVSNQCRILLRKNYALHGKWVGSAYKRLNEALEAGDKNEIDKLSYEASKRMFSNEKG